MSHDAAILDGRGYSRDRAWSDKYVPEIMEIVGPRLLSIADFYRDASEATDLIVFKACDMRIAARMRQPGFAELYPTEFTIRRSRRSGSKTELMKIFEGWGDWFFYGHAKEGEELKICRWWLIDLAQFRCQMLVSGMGAGRPRTINNRDGTTSFTVFDLEDFHPSILIDGSHRNELCFRGWARRESVLS